MVPLFPAGEAGEGVERGGGAVAGLVVPAAGEIWALARVLWVLWGLGRDAIVEGVAPCDI